MKNAIVRLQSVELSQFKNVAYGKIELPSATSKDYSCDNSDILGIYGQNGSGKTSVVDALYFLKFLLSDESLPKNTGDYISKTSDFSRCTISFYLENDSNKLLIDYSFCISKSSEKDAFVSYEKLSCKKNVDGVWKNKSTLIEYFFDKDEQFFLPKKCWDSAVMANKENRIDLAVAKKISFKEGKSFIFSSDTRKILTNTLDRETLLPFVLSTLHRYAQTNLFVIRNEHTTNISLDIALPFSFKYEEESTKSEMGDLVISLSEPTTQPLNKYKMFKNMLKETNQVIRVLIPGMSLEIKEYGEQITAGGKAGMRFEVLSVRNENRIPIKYESEGIKKILSILNILIAMYNNTSVCVAIDELDAGIYEYLLGELLGIIEDSGNGQLIFTSHNLRPLEMINKNNLIFTTTNPQNRYIKLTNVKSKNNLRDLYIRSINLGGQKEIIYETTNAFEISRAFRKGRRNEDEDQ